MTNSSETTCPITGEPAVSDIPGGDYFFYNVFNAGIKYKIAGTAQTLLEGPKYTPDPTIGENTGFYAQLAYWIYQRNQKGVEQPMIDDETLEQIKSQPYPSIDERISSYLQWVNKQCNSDFSKNVGNSDDRAGMVASCARNDQEQGVFIETLEQNGYLDCIDACSKDGKHYIHIKLTLAGLQHCEELQTTYSASKEIFVAMWFDDRMDGYFKHIQAAIEKESEFKVTRIDRINHNNKIDDEIIARLKSCRLVIADFTCDDNGKAHRGGVYYEAGFAQGLNKNVIFTVDKDCVDNLHFDTRQFNHIVWEENKGGEFLETNPKDAKNPKTLAESIIDRIKAIEI